MIKFRSGAPDSIIEKHCIDLNYKTHIHRHNQIRKWVKVGMPFVYDHVIDSTIAHFNQAMHPK